MATSARLWGVREDEVPPDRRSRAPARHDGGAILRHLADFLDAFMWQADPTTLEITFITSSVRDILGDDATSWIGPPERWSRHVHSDDRKRIVDCVRATASDGADRETEFRAEAADGSVKTLRLAVRLLVPPSGRAELWGVTHDLTGDKRTAAALRASEERYRSMSEQAAAFRRQALEDPLTQLPNRILFDDRIGTTLRSAQRAGTSFAVLLMDLDRFKEINDTLGHQAGDAVLKHVALRLRICLRGQDTPARLGGDEFAAVLPNTDEAGAVRVADRIAGALGDPIPLEEGTIELGASIGIALFPIHASESEELLALADVAMYRAKAAGVGVSVATAGEEMPAAPRRDPPHRSRRRVARTAIGVAAGLAILAGAMSPVASRRSSHEPASRLDDAVVVLGAASGEDVGAVVAGVEETLAEISFNEVAVPDVVTALARLEHLLHGLRPEIVGALGARVERLIDSIHRAELLAELQLEVRRITRHARPGPPVPRAVIDSAPVPQPDAPAPTLTPTAVKPALP